MVDGTIDETSCHRVEMNVENDPIEVALLVDRFRVIAALPKGASPSSPSIEPLAEPALKVLKPSRYRDRPAPNGEVIVVGHQGPGEENEPVPPLDPLQNVDERCGLRFVREHGLAARCAAVHVVDPAIDEHSRLSRHRLSPSGRRD